MTSIPAPLPGAADSGDRSLGKHSRSWDRIEALLDRGSEWLNPILVKEARQALKSWQFVITFTVILTCGWLWTIFGVVFSMPGIAYGGGGQLMLMGYFYVLSLPLLVIVPFSAFRSLAAEREDGTFELISITALNARQIVSGKLGSAILQMMVHFSAMAPCVAFTYLLRGIDVFSIFFVLYYTFLCSLLLATFGLLVATISRSRHWQVLLSVLLLLVLFIAWITWISFITNSVWLDLWRADLPVFWALQGCILTFVLSFFVLILWTAGAQISFASDNRSSRLRYVMLAQQVLWIGWMTYFWAALQFPPIAVVMLTIAAIYWMVMGSLLIGEHPQLSPRVRRELPQTYFGRMLLTWFNPGSGTGYAFAVLNLATLGIWTIALHTWNVEAGTTQSNYITYEGLLIYVALIVSYTAIYLGVSRLIVLLARNAAAVGMVFSLLITILIVLAGAALPLLFQFWLFNYQLDSYTELQITNWCWTMLEAAEGRLAAQTIVWLFLVVGAIVIFVVNIILATGEIAQTRLIAPRRVLEDAAAALPATKRKSSPWDDDPLESDRAPGA
jgi:hypothetical protein